MTDFSGVERQERVKWPVLIPGVYVCAYVGMFLRPVQKRMWVIGRLHFPGVTVTLSCTTAA